MSTPASPCGYHLAVRVIETIPVAWSPYAVTFSHDGTRLAIGGGSWYGLGGITLIDLRTRERADLTMGPIDPSLLTHKRKDVAQRSVSGLAFTADDRHLLVSTWTSGVGQGAALAFEVDHLELRQVAAYVSQEPLTGIVPHRAGAAVRVWRENAHRTIGTVQWPADLRLAGPGRTELTSHRLAVVHGHGVTGDHGASDAERPGLLVKPFGSSSSSRFHEGDAPITAIGHQGDALISGTATGTLASWRWEGSYPVLEHLIGRIETTREDPSALWAIYQPAAVVGICVTADGGHAAITAGGTLATWTLEGALESYPLDVPGTARTIAASPDRTLLAIGIKCGDRSSVLLVELAAEVLESAWKTPRARQVAASFDADRPLDPVTLSVLADALEESGAAPGVLHHLRTHERRLCTCWVVDQLREVLPSR